MSPALKRGRLYFVSVTLLSAVGFIALPLFILGDSLTRNLSFWMMLIPSWLTCCVLAWVVWSVILPRLPNLWGGIITSVLTTSLCYIVSPYAFFLLIHALGPEPSALRLPDAQGVGGISTLLIIMTGWYYFPISMFIGALFGAWVETYREID